MKFEFHPLSFLSSTMGNLKSVALRWLATSRLYWSKDTSAAANPFRFFGNLFCILSLIRFLPQSTSRLVLPTAGLVSLFLIPFSSLGDNDKCSLKGRVLDPSGRPLPYALIIGKAPASHCTYTNAMGEFIIENADCQKQAFECRHMGFVTYIDTVSCTEYIEVNLKELDLMIDEVTVTATRGEKRIEDIPQPVSIISGETIKNMGSVRLSDVLAEQTGLVLQSDHGTGVQMQGLGAEYTLIMINGQPVIGRTSGTLELDRIAVNNIKRIEITKGPASSLYGSEALAGVINIITEEPSQPFRTEVIARTKTYNTYDLSGNIEKAQKKWNANLFVNRYSSDGYDLTPESISQTSAKFASYTLNGRVNYLFSQALKLTIDGRYFIQKSTDILSVTDNGIDNQLDDKGQQYDWSLMPTLIARVNPKLKITALNYTTSYATHSSLTYTESGKIYDESSFEQFFNRTEVMADYFANLSHQITVGAGTIVEGLASTRYQNPPHFYSQYIFAQHEWRLRHEKATVLAGLRFDNHSQYANQLSPKLSAQYKINKKIRINGSVGVGFKAPDFRQLFLNFTNPTAGYTVLGSNLVQTEMPKLVASGQVEEVLRDPNTLEKIDAEKSVSFNLGMEYKPTKQLIFRTNIFTSFVENLIESAPIAIYKSGSSIYSYFNVNSVNMRGLEQEIKYSPIDGLNFSLGYQYLEALDQEALDKIADGKIYARNPTTLNTYKVSRSQYGGLFNRSRHTANAKGFYSIKKLNADIAYRIIYRGKFGFGDLNGNQILDIDDEYADDYFVHNLTIGKKFTKSKNFGLQLGIENIFDIRNQYVPTMPGRIFMASLSYKFDYKPESN